MKKILYYAALVLMTASVACQQKTNADNETSGNGGEAAGKESILVSQQNLTPTFIQVEEGDWWKKTDADGFAMLHIKGADVLAAGIQKTHLEHIHVHVNDDVYVPLDQEITNGGVSVPVRIPDGEFSVTACYSVQQQMSPDGFGLSLAEAPEGVRLYGVSDDYGYKYFDCYLQVPDAFTLTKVEYRMGGGNWQPLEGNGCSYSRLDALLGNVYKISVRPGFQNVSADVQLKVSGEQHGIFRILWENNTSKYVDLEKSKFPAQAIDGETVVAEIWTLEPYYLSGVSAPASTGVQLLQRAYVRFTMPSENVTVSLLFREKIPVSVSAGANIESVQLYSYPDIYSGVPVERGIPGDKVYVLAHANAGFKPCEVSIPGGDVFTPTHYAYDYYFFEVTIPEKATSLSLGSKARQAWTVTPGTGVWMNAGNLFWEGEDVGCTIEIPENQQIDKVTVLTSGGQAISFTRDVTYVHFTMPRDNVSVSVTYKALDGGTVHVQASFDADQYHVYSSTNYNWNFAQGFDVAMGSNIYLQVDDYYGENFFVGIKIGTQLTVYEATMDPDMGEYSFGRSIQASADINIKVGASRNSVTF
ncbi:MAG: hypothetical protein J6Y31_05390 [Bacteroidales bacterium]|nr:hypothetical protein [Bacteroidales bacterium]